MTHSNRNKMRRRDKAAQVEKATGVWMATLHEKGSVLDLRSKKRKL